MTFSMRFEVERLLADGRVLARLVDELAGHPRVPLEDALTMLDVIETMEHVAELARGEEPR